MFGFLKMSRNVWNCGTRCRFGEFAAAAVVGTLANPLASLTRASVLVVMYLTNSHAAASFELPFGIPMMLPVM